MDFSSAPADGAGMNMGHGLVWSNGVLQQQQQEQSQSNSSDSSSAIPYATPTIDGYGQGQSGNYIGSWVTTEAAPAAPAAASAANYYHQAAKPNVAFYQTPIFGMEWCESK